MKVIGRDNGKNKVMLEDRSVVLMTDAELEAATNPPAEKPQAKAVKSAPETKDVKAPEDTK